MIVRFLLACLALAMVANPAAAQKRIAFSFDDVPRGAGGFFTPDERTETLIAALNEAGIEQAAFFVTVGNLEHPDGKGGEARIAAYVAAGHVIANHSYSHSWLSRTPAAEYIGDLDRAEAWLKDKPGHRPWFRFPFLDEAGKDTAKRDAVRAALRERGLANGYVTIDDYDWHLEARAKRAQLEGKPIDMAALSELYVETMVDAANFYDRIAVDALGRSPAHVILLHETDMAALFIADLASALRADGWEIIPIDEAYRDPIAAIEPDTAFLNGGRVSAIAAAQGKPLRNLMHDRADETVLDRLFDARVLKDKPAP